ncbi:MAG: DNA polymerase III subunit gamma/tau [Fidelibacterota bacterium]
MGYQILSLKWRPQVFADVVGQNHVTRTLENAFKKNRIAQGYLFTGPRGVGKTTTARILAKVLNCQAPKDSRPCNECSTCQEIIDSRNMDVLEIDGASNRGIEEIRNLRELIKFPPINAPYKIFIIDEVHMLTTPAFNALLRTLEEPPPHGKFILCTTDVHKVPPTIVSRCQRFDFNRITGPIIAKRLNHILQEEGITIDQDSLEAISRKADGSMRDALSLVDQVIAFSGDNITYDDVVQVLGLIPVDLYFRFTNSLRQKDGETLLNLLNEIRFSGVPLPDLIGGLNQHLRNLLIASFTKGVQILELNDELKQRYLEESKAWDTRDLLRISQILIQTEQQLKRASHPYLLLEMTAFRMLEMDKTVSIEALIQELKASPNTRTSAAPISTEAKPSPGSVREPDTLPLELEQPAVKEASKNTPAEPKTAPSTTSEPLQELQAKWNQIIAEVMRERPSIGLALENCRPLAVRNNKVDVGLTGDIPFNAELVKKNSRYLEQALQAVMGKPFVVLFKPMEGKMSAPKAEPKQAPESKTPQDSPVVSRVIELFDGEIVR